MNKSFSLTLFFIVLILALTYAQEDCCTVNTISTTGSATVQINPDIAQIIIIASATANTSAKALSEVNADIKAVVAVFKSFNITSKNYSTSSISMSQNINYSTTPYKVTGQSVSQSITLRVGHLSNLSYLIEKIAQVNISISSLQFYSSNPEPGLLIARKAAFVDALIKFQQYLSLTKLKNGGLKKIMDLNNEQYPRIQSSFAQFAQSSVKIPIGQIQISASVEAVWATKV